MSMQQVNMRMCIVCDTLIFSNSSIMELVDAECRRAGCSQPCVHGWLKSQNQHLCPVCKYVVGAGGNRFAPNFGSSNTIDDNRNNMPPADRRTEASDDLSSCMCTMGLYWTYITIVIIIIAMLCVVSYIF